MSHRYGERLLPHSQGRPNSSLPSESSILSNDPAKDAPTTQADSVRVTKIAIDSIIDYESGQTEAWKDALQPPTPQEMNSWTLIQFRAHLEDLVMQKRRVSGQVRADLESRRLSTIDRITRIERAEMKKRDTARRVVIGRDVAPPPPDPVEKPWRKKRFGPNTRRSGPEDARKRVKKGDEDGEENPEEELHSKRWKLKRKRVQAEEEQVEEEISDEVADEDAGQGAEQREDGLEVDDGST